MKIKAKSLQNKENVSDILLVFLNYIAQEFLSFMQQDVLLLCMWMHKVLTETIKIIVTVSIIGNCRAKITLRKREKTKGMITDGSNMIHSFLFINE